MHLLWTQHLYVIHNMELAIALLPNLPHGFILLLDVSPSVPLTINFVLLMLTFLPLLSSAAFHKLSILCHLIPIIYIMIFTMCSIQILSSHCWRTQPHVFLFLYVLTTFNIFSIFVHVLHKLGYWDFCRGYHSLCISQSCFQISSIVSCMLLSCYYFNFHIPPLRVSSFFS